MRIISKFKDYYDGLTDNTDNEHVWIRHKKTDIISPSENNVFKNIHLPLFHERMFSDIELHCFYLLFCGELIPFINIKEGSNGDKLNTITRQTIQKNKIINSYEMFVDGYNDILKLENNNTWKKPISYTKPKTQYGLEYNIFKLFDESYYKQFEDKLKSLHFEYDSPIILIRADNVSKDNKQKQYHDYYYFYNIVLDINPTLMDINFHKGLDSYQCFQKIDIFLFNELYVQEKPLPKMSDKSIAQSKGFGHKYAFRKEPKNK